MSDDYGRREWQVDEAAAKAEAVRRIHAAADSGAEVLDFTDLGAMTALPEDLALVPGVKHLFAGDWTPEGQRTPFYTFNLADLSALRHLPGLQTLNLYRTKVSDLSPLSTLTALTGLYVSYTQVSDLTPLSTLTALTKLDVRGTQVSDLTPLSPLTALTSLNVGYTQVRDLAPLSTLTALTSLDVSNTWVSDLAPLSSLIALSSLDVSNGIVNDLTPLSPIASLNQLKLSNTMVNDLAPLSELAVLNTLDVSFSKSVRDLSPLASLNALTALDIRNTSVSDLTPLSGLASLSTLDIRKSQVRDLAPLLAIPNFAAEDGNELRFSGTPAAKRNLQFAALARIPPKRCGVETVQYLKGTHPDFRDPPPARQPVPFRLAALSPVALDLSNGQVRVANPGPAAAPDAPDLGQRLSAMRVLVQDLCQDAPVAQIEPRHCRRFDGYRDALQAKEPNHYLLDVHMVALRAAVADPGVTRELPPHFVAQWQHLVALHDEIKPRLTRTEEKELPLLPHVEEAEVVEVAAEAMEILEPAQAGGAVEASVVAAMGSIKDYYDAKRAGLLQPKGRGPVVVAAIITGLASVAGFPIWIGKAAEGLDKVQKFLATHWGQRIAERLRHLADKVKGWFE